MAPLLAAGNTVVLKPAQVCSFLHCKLDKKKHKRVGLKSEISSCSNIGSIRNDPNWTSRKNSLELIELSSINKVRAVHMSRASPANRADLIPLPLMGA